MKPRAWLAAALALVLALLAGLVFVLDEPADTETARRGFVPRPARTLDVVDPGLAAADGQGAGDGSAQAAARSGVSRRPELTPTPESAPLLESLRGNVVVFDPDGRELPRGDGELTLRAWLGDGISTLVEARVLGGSWSVPLEDLLGASHLTIERLRIGEHFPVVESPAGEFTPPAERFLEVRARQPRRSILRVVAARDGRDLAGVHLVLAQGFPYQDATHPGAVIEELALARDLVSPIDLHTALDESRRRETLSLLVGCEGYAWVPVLIDFERGGERRVVLGPGGDLEVVLLGHDPASRAELRLRRGEDGSKPFAAQSLAESERALFAGLVPGEVHVSVEVGDWWQKPLRLGEATLEVRAGALAQATIALEAAPAVEYADLSGRVLVPKAWELSRVLVTAELTGTPLAGFEPHQTTDATPSGAAGRAGFDEHTWSFRGMQVGRYELGLRDPPFSIVVDLPAGGRVDQVIELPPPALLFVRVVDAITGEDVVTGALKWNPRRPEGVTGGGLERTERDPETGLYPIRAPAMAIDLTLWDWGYEPVDERVDLSRGTTHHTLHLDRASGIEVSLMDGDTAVPFPKGARTSPEPAPGTDGRVSLSQYAEFIWRFQIAGPGRYTLELPAVPGYVPPQPQEIDVIDGQVTSIVFELDRELR